MTASYSHMATSIILPATEPSDGTFGSVAAEGLAPEDYHAVPFERLVWYNQAIRSDAFAKLSAAGLKPTGHQLIGFSKSGLGALLMALEQPDWFSDCVVFDAPVCLAERPNWQTAEFFTDETWRADLPWAHVAAIAQLPITFHFITGESFADQMRRFFEAFQAHGGRGSLADRVLPHHWNAGWLQPAVQAFHSA